MAGDPADATALAVIASRLDDVRDDISGLRSDVTRFSTLHVTRGEWEQRNNYSDTRFAGLGREIGDLRSELGSRRAPWWSVAAIVIAGASALFTILQP
ncbi:hypothetical protein [Microbacterium sp. T2.11-28]|uniref:hypothetical protein n=1 Tax=Microbacterium sp. T2.11-28 TaxID=3041169 RepID=UPI0024775838|nr:hypothetical protein [Microbacterium sp. T2.11-28]CAI9386094.1 hypothetical protein MICABA_00174 [Microbacterium sp. T2.11-28]